MDGPNLLIVCISSFVAVLFILSFLAVVMHFLLIIFPVKPKEDDTTIIAAITTAYNNQYPGTRITNIGEEK